MIEIRFCPTYEEYLEGTKADLRVQCGRRAGLCAMLAAILAIAGGTYLIVTEPLGNSGYVMTSLGAVWIFFQTIGFRLWVKSEYRKQRALPQEWTHEIDEDKIRSVSEVANGELAWKAFTRVVETDHLFLLYSDRQLFQCFPKRAFDSQALESFRDLLKRKVNSPS